MDVTWLTVLWSLGAGFIGGWCSWRLCAAFLRRSLREVEFDQAALTDKVMREQKRAAGRARQAGGIDDEQLQQLLALKQEPDAAGMPRPNHKLNLFSRAGRGTLPPRAGTGA